MNHTNKSNESCALNESYEVSLNVVYDHINRTVYKTLNKTTDFLSPQDFTEPSLGPSLMAKSQKAKKAKRPKKAKKFLFHCYM